MKKEVLKKIPVSKNRQLWILAGKRNDQVCVELRIHHSTLNGLSLPTRHGFEIPIRAIQHLQQTFSELLRVESITKTHNPWAREPNYRQKLRHE